MKNWLDKYEYGGQAGYTDVPFDYNSAWGGQFQLGGNVYPVNYVPQAAVGGSLPGAVGFTYARTAGAAPSNGPYAKKTKASAQDGIKKQKEWLQSYLQSPKYKERLKKEFAGKDDAFIDNEVNARLNNLLNTKVNYVKSIGSEPGWISGLAMPKQYEGESWDYKEKRFVPNKWSPDPYGRGMDKKGYIYLESEYNPKAWNPSEGFDTVPLHELGHAADDGGYRIPLSTKKKIYNYTQSEDRPNYRSNGMTFDYYNTPTEFINRIQPIRYLLNSEGLYDTRTKDFTEKDYNNMMKNKNINKNVHYQDVMKSLKGTPEQKKKAFIDLMNSVAMQDNDTNLDVAENGKEMSYYQHGLDWKPKSMENGGWLDKHTPKAQVGETVGPYESNANSSNVPVSLVPTLGKTTPEVAPSGFNYDDYYSKANKYLSRPTFKNTELKPEHIAKSAQEFYDKTGYEYPLDLLLTQAQMETGLGTKLKSKYNYFNVGNTDSGAVKNYETPEQSLLEYMGVMYNDYLEKGKKKVTDLLKPKGFVNYAGNRYASAPDYEKKLLAQKNFIAKKLSLEEGGVIKDDRGQWDHPGEITEIGSNQITMQGVPYPVLGISDEGDTQMMYPEQEYKFKGKKVTEYPMAQKGRKIANDKSTKKFWKKLEDYYTSDKATDVDKAKYKTFKEYNEQHGYAPVRITDRTLMGKRQMTNPFTGEISVIAPDETDPQYASILMNEYLDEYPHYQQFNKNPNESNVRKSLRFLGHMGKDYRTMLSNLPNTGFNFKKAYEKAYDTPGTLEYEAHEVLGKKMDDELMSILEKNLPPKQKKGGWLDKYN